MKDIVVYYSRKGSNLYLANRISESLQCDKEEIRPRLNFFLFFLMGISIGNKALKHKLNEYDRVILCGPIWMGKFILPLHNFVKKCNRQISNLYFITCCGSGYEVKDEKFGHGLVFNEVRKLLGEKCIHCEAFPIGLVVPDELKNNSDAIMHFHLSDENFKGEILSRFNAFIQFMKTN